MADFVNDPQEPSYYEIALTNRQVLVAFVVLLLSILGAFVGGVWLGRGGAQPADAGVIAEIDETPSDLEGVEELTFFSEKEGESRTKPAGETTLAQDIGASGAVPDRAPPSASRPRTPPPSTPPPPPPPPPSTQTQPAAPPPTQTQPAPTQPTPTRSTTANPGATAPRSTGPGFVIQVFSGRDETQARQVLKRLRNDGREAFLSPVEVGSLTMYRVRVGPFGDRARADRAANEITKKHKLDTWITAVD